MQDIHTVVGTGLCEGVGRDHEYGTVETGASDGRRQGLPSTVELVAIEHGHIVGGRGLEHVEDSLQSTRVLVASE